MKKIRQTAYRPDIDGIRAIAVLAVILFHINSHLVPGGFVGVDIFFVISGFLISQHIMRDIEREKFSLPEFYRRRVKRLALPLLLVVALTMLAGYALMIPDDFKQAANSGLYALISLANVFFWLFQDTSYFAADSKAIPLLHLWSLGVEEQFYILWPLLLMFTYRRARSKIFLAFASVFALASFVFGEWWFQHDASFVYYMLPARAGELLVGAMVAMAVLRGVKNRVPKNASIFMATVGLAMLVLSLFLLNEDQVFPGMRALLPTFGTALLILAGHCGDNRVSNLLAARPLVAVGLISYSAYLWHWPILAFLRYEHVAINLLWGAAALFLTLWLSFLSYMLVELPAREWNAKLNRVFLFQYIVPAIVIASLLVAGKQRVSAAPAVNDAAHHAEMHEHVATASEVIAPQIELVSEVAATSVAPTPEASKTVIAPVAKVLQTMSELDTGLHDQPLPAHLFDYVCQRERITTVDAQNKKCVLGGGDETVPRVVLWGDSQAAHYIGVVGAITKQMGVKFRNLELDSCPPLLADSAPYVVAKRLADCRASTALMRATVEAADVVIISSAWSDYFARSDTFFDATFATIEQLTAAGKLVIIMGKAPVIMSFDSKCRDKAKQSGLPMDCSFKEPLTAEVIAANTKLQAFAEHTPNVGYFDVTAYLCKDGICSAADAAGNPLYFDAGHLSLPASWKIGESVVRQQGVPPPFARIKSWLEKNKNTQ